MDNKGLLYGNNNSTNKVGKLNIIYLNQLVLNKTTIANFDDTFLSTFGTNLNEINNENIDAPGDNPKLSLTNTVGCNDNSMIHTCECTINNQCITIQPQNTCNNTLDFCQTNFICQTDDCKNTIDLNCANSDACLTKICNKELSIDVNCGYYTQNNLECHDTIKQTIDCITNVCSINTNCTTFDNYTNPAECIHLETKAYCNTNDFVCINPHITFNACEMGNSNIYTCLNC